MKSTFLQPFKICLRSAALAAATVGSLFSAEEKPADRDAGVDYFNTYIEPLLQEHCYDCHSHEAKKSKGGLMLDSRKGILEGGDSGPAAISGDPEKSLLLTALHYTDEDLQMPPDEMLPDDVIAQFAEWIEKGLPHAKRGKAQTETGPDFDHLTQTHWSLQPVENPKTPAPNDASWPWTDIDRFVLARLEAEELNPVADAEPATLLRRIWFDLTGLPPDPAAIDAFLFTTPAERSKRFETIVDELLASPHFGERWGRHWLDVARFAESNGKSRDVLMPHAWRYRNYVFDAFASDLPFNQFIAEQVAGDLLPAKTPEDRDRQKIATGFLAVGSKSLTEGNFDMDLVDDQIDAMSQSVLGLTVACARCHDHKFDPIRTADYYALAGIFKSTDTLYGRGLGNRKSAEYQLLAALGPDSEAQVAAAKARDKEIAAITKRQGNLATKVKTLQGKLPKDWKERSKKLASIDSNATTEEAEGRESKEDQQVRAFVQAQNELKKAQDELKAAKSQPGPVLEYAMAVRDSAKPADIKIHVRGEPGNLGDTVPRGFIESVRIEQAAAVDPKKSGRLELAQWLSHPENPLTARVIVNRTWQHLFGRGLVASPNNFGINGEAPSHPELLDFLAHRFVHEHGWSVKSLIGEIVLSRSYQLSGTLDETNYAADPENRLVWRMSRKRLEAEPLRDAILAASGDLQLKRPDFGSPVAQMGNGEVGRGENTKPLEAPFPYRTAYFPVLRTRMNAFLKTFDYPEPSNPQGERISTNVPAQALWLMNSPFVNEQSEKFARRILESSDDREDRIALAFKLAWSRPPSVTEIAQMIYFLENNSSESELNRWTSLTQALISGAEFRYLN